MALGRSTPQDSPRIAAMREFCDRHGWEFNSWTGSQREPGDGVSIRLGTGVKAMALRSESHDGLGVAVARMEQALSQLADASRDVYPIRKQIFEWLQEKPNPASIGSMVDAIEDLRDYAKAFYQVGVLVDAELIEKVWGTNLYRVVER